MHRRHFLTAAAASALMSGCVSADAQGESFEVTRSADEWRDLLTDAEFDVMREMGTEARNSSPLNAIKQAGMYHCKGCDQALYPSDTKFESGTGWPSFWAPVAETAVATQPDPGLFGTRTEVHCSRCGSHQGHIFDDGPEPTGKRHCINGIAMVFRPEGGGQPVVG